MRKRRRRARAPGSGHSPTFWRARALAVTATSATERSSRTAPSVGDRVTVKNQVMIFEGVHIADDVFLGPGVIFTNDLRPRAHIKRHGAELLTTTVQQGATLGAGVVVVCGVTIGEHAFVGAGAVVIERCARARFRGRQPWSTDRLGLRLW